MSFNFRNIFTPDDPEFQDPAGAGAANGFSAPAGAQPGRGNLAPEAAPSSRGQSFLASELLPLVPPAIVASSGIPMEKEIVVPVPADGSLDVRLSTIYQLCPELFAAEITPLNDSVITLPPRVGATPAMAGSANAMAGSANAMVASGAFSKPEASAAGAGAAFWSPVTPVKTAGATEAANPFSAEAGAKNAFSAPSESAPAAKPKMAGGFDAPPAVPGGNAFSAPAATPAAAPATEAAASGPGTMPPGGFFGFNAPPMAKSEGESASSANPFESDKGFATLFSKQAEQDAAIPHPSGPFGAPPKAPESEGVWGAMFRGEVKDETAAAEPDFESIGNLLSQAKKPAEAPAPVFTPPTQPAPPAAESFAAGFAAFAPPATPAAGETPGPEKAPATQVAWSFDQTPPPAQVPTTPPASTMNPAASVFQAPEAFAPPASPTVAAAPPKEPDPAPVAETPAGFGFASGFGSAFTEPAPAPAPAPAPVEEAPAASPAAAAVEAVFAAASAPVSEVVEKPAPAPVKGEPAAASPAPVAAPEVVKESAPAPANAAASASEEDDLRDLEMRAIFSTSERFNLSMVARKVVALPGINSCSLSTPAKIVHASRRDETRLGNEAREMIATLRSLAKLTGLPEARTFTLQTDRGIVSLFLEGDCCVTVNQEQAAFQPGVREKLILIARSIGKLRD